MTKIKQRNFMKKYLFSNFAVTMLMALFAFSTLSSCSEEVLEEKQESQDVNLDIPENVTVFSTAVDEATRTSLDLDAYFYWTDYDKIWVDVDNNSSFTTGSSNMEMSGDKRLARFFFSGVSMEANSYNLTYTGVNSTSGTSVTIPQDQSQTAPNDATHVGRNGDCATAVATKNAKGQYTFTLSHKAHYLILQPYQDPVINTKTWKVKKIEIISLDDETLGGTFAFDMDGLDVEHASSPSTTITIDNIGGAAGVALNKVKASDNPAWYAVIAPATDGYHNLRIKYTIDPDAYINFDGNGEPTKGDMVIVKDLTINSAANKVTKIAHKMTLMTFPTNVFYMWDATAPYCSSSFKLMHYGQTVDVIPTSGDPNYTPFTENAPAGGRAAANSPCSGLPNVNAASWYVYAGDPRWETEYPWHYDGDTGFDYIYTLGAWIKKWDVIVSENSEHLAGKSFTDCDVSFIGNHVTVYRKNAETGEMEIAGYRDYDGTDYRKNAFPGKMYNQGHFQSRAPSYQFNGRPKDTSNYFFLPANDCINGSGKLLTTGSIHGCYWLSSAVPGKTIATLLEMKNFNIRITNDNGNPQSGRPALAGWWQ